LEDPAVALNGIFIAANFQLLVVKDHEYQVDERFWDSPHFKYTTQGPTITRIESFLEVYERDVKREVRERLGRLNKVLQTDDVLLTAA
jgi:hypothetical protein